MEKKTWARQGARKVLVHKNVDAKENRIDVQLLTGVRGMCRCLNLGANYKNVKFKH